MCVYVCVCVCVRVCVCVCFCCCQSDDEEEMPPEARLRMRNVGKYVHIMLYCVHIMLLLKLVLHELIYTCFNEK